MRISNRLIFTAIITFLFCAGHLTVHGQIPTSKERKFKVVDGVLREILNPQSDSLASFVQITDEQRDSLTVVSGTLRIEADSLIARAGNLVEEDPDNGIAADSLRRRAASIISEADSLMNVATFVTPQTPEEEELTSLIIQDSIPDKLSKRQERRLENQRRYADSLFVRHSKVFRDSMPLSRMSWISVAVPGFSQLYNRQAWKIPILYGTVGASLYFGFQQNKHYSFYNEQYIAYQNNNPGAIRRPDPAFDAIHTKVIQHNTRRQLLFGAAIATYIYFLGDGVLNYPNEATNVKKATTLSTMFPGAGQVYNKSYWRVPWVAGAVATFAFMIDWNNRGYQRFKFAYDQRTTAEALAAESGNPPSYFDEFATGGGSSFSVPTESIKNYKNNYRRNRDLCIILMGAAYLLNIIDAHVDAHLQEYDISDDLNFSLEPAMMNFSSSRSGNAQLMGFNFKIHF